MPAPRSRARPAAPGGPWLHQRDLRERPPDRGADGRRGRRRAAAGDESAPGGGGIRRALVALVVLAGIAGRGSGEVDDPAQRARLATIRQATQIYENVNAALPAGYRPPPQCLESDNETGALGQADANLRLNADQQIDRRGRAALLRGVPDGLLVLVGVGYGCPTRTSVRPTLTSATSTARSRRRPGSARPLRVHARVHLANPDGPLATWSPTWNAYDARIGLTAG